MSMKLQHGGIVVTDVLAPFMTSFAMSHRPLQFEEIRLETKTAFLLGGIRRIPDSCHEAVCITKTLRAIARSARRPRSGCPRPLRSAPGQMVTLQLSKSKSPRLFCPWRKRAMD